MAKSARSKAFSKFKFELKNVALNDEGWMELERRWKTKLPDIARNRINVANALFASVAPLHSSENTVTLRKVENALNAWIKATGRLRLALQLPTSTLSVQSRAEIIAKFYSAKKIKKIGKMQPIVFARYVIDAATEAALLTLAELAENHMDPELKRDLWLAWVMFLADVARGAGAQVTASSSNKLKTESPFVSGVLYLQESFPKECRHYAGYDSVVKGVQLAKKKYSRETPETMLAMIATWGVNLPGFDSQNRSDAKAVLANLGIGSL